MGEIMEFPDTVEEFMEEYKMVDKHEIYSNGTEYVPIFRMKQWFEHCRVRSTNAKRYIDADALIKDLKRQYMFLFGTDELPNGIQGVIKNFTTVDVREVVHGEWFPIDVGDCCYRCSVCNFVRDAYLLEEDNYCPHCGARMDGAR